MQLLQWNVWERNPSKELQDTNEKPQELPATTGHLRRCFWRSSVNNVLNSRPQERLSSSLYLLQNDTKFKDDRVQSHCGVYNVDVHFRRTVALNERNLQSNGSFKQTVSLNGQNLQHLQLASSKELYLQTASCDFESRSRNVLFESVG